MTVIFSNRGDQDCLSLTRVFDGIDDVKLVELKRCDTDPIKRLNDKRAVEKAMAEEEDTLVIIGHGSPNGLFYPDFDGYAVNDSNYRLIRARNLICIWCFASEFCMRHRLHAFASSMFISNVSEAMMNGIYGYSPLQIDQNATRFYTEVNGMLKDKTPLTEWVDKLTGNVDKNNKVDVFNREALYFD